MELEDEGKGRWGRISRMKRKEEDLVYLLKQEREGGGMACMGCILQHGMGCVPTTLSCQITRHAMVNYWPKEMVF